MVGLEVNVGLITEGGPRIGGEKVGAECMTDLTLFAMFGSEVSLVVLRAKVCLFGELKAGRGLSTR